MNEHRHTDEDEVRSYELAFHVVSTIPEADVASEVTKLRTLIESKGGSIFGEDFPALIDLAYPIRTMIARKAHVFDTAYFGWIRFEAPASEAHIIKETLNTHEHILRFLVVKIDRNAPVVSYVPPSTAKTVPMDNDAEKQTKEVSSENEEAPMTTEQMDAEIDKLVA